ncbi:MAG: DNA (cytosine-5-)-methyltransferase [Thiothrix sp.]|nr:MAG: DNA (cytosine-5-)-methyltransferase [Thiothrix sp.]
MKSKLNFIDLFAGAGGLSEGFVQAGFNPVAHVEVDKAACFTLKTRQAFYWLKENNKIDLYKSYLMGEINRAEFYNYIPEEIIDSIINIEITKDSIDSIFEKIDLLKNDRSIDIIIGGPPCQAYSVIGRARGIPNSDPRNYLYEHYAKFLEYYQPKYFVFENVTGLLSAKDSSGQLYLRSMLNLFDKIGYSVEYKVLSAEDYGILQRRKRIILIGKKGKATNFYPNLEPVSQKYLVADLLQDLPKIKAGEGSWLPCKLAEQSSPWLAETNIKTQLPVTWHQARPHTLQDLNIYKIAVELWNKDQSRLDYSKLPHHLRTHKDIKSFTDRFKVIASDHPYTHTLVAHISKDGHHYIHPDIEQNRSITPREAARIQTFPDDYFFESASGKPSRTMAFKQIGNAVPVRLAYLIATKLNSQI